jgi:hypothetical protein
MDVVASFWLRRRKTSSICVDLKTKKEPVPKYAFMLSSSNRGRLYVRCQGHWNPTSDFTRSMVSVACSRARRAPSSNT